MESMENMENTESRQQPETRRLSGTTKDAASGFTLIELMIVVAIIGILAALAVPLYNSYVTRSQTSEALILAGSLKPAVIIYMINNKACPHNATAPADGLPLASSITGNHVAQVETGGTYASNGDSCTLTATFKTQDVGAALRAKSIQFQAISHDGATRWVCTSTQIRQRYLPPTCQGL